MIKLNVGDKFIAIDPCKMIRTGETSLTVGKEYEVIDFDYEEDGDCIVIIDDSNEEHLFSVIDLHKWFDVSELPLYTYKTGPSK
jgi:hypothetical protein